MKPFDGNFAENAIKHGVAGLNIDGCRIQMGAEDRADYEAKRRSFDGLAGKVCGDKFVKNASPLFSSDELIKNSQKGRFPANVIVQDSEGVIQAFPETTSGNARIGKTGHSTGNALWGKHFLQKQNAITSCFGDSGSAARFFKQVKEYEE
jgi:hypothetical protein